MTNMKDANNERSFTDQECQAPDAINSVNIDPVPGQCADDYWPSQKRVGVFKNLSNPPFDWKSRQCGRPKLGIGQQANCDPLMTGQIVNDLDTPNRDVVYRYSRALRGANEAMLDLFRNMNVLDEEGKAHTIPIVWASQEKAVAALLQDNVRKDNSLVVDRIRLPIMAIYANNYAFDPERFTYQKAMSLLQWLDPAGEAGFTQREKFEKDTVFGVTRGIPVNISYTLFAWTLYQEDMDEILEQVMLKFSPVAYIKVRGVYWEIIVTLDGQANNLDIEPGDNKLRVFKYQFTMTAKSYIPQPITRIKIPDVVAALSEYSDEDLRKAVAELEKGINNLSK
jgi:hypothetical protein